MSAAKAGTEMEAVRAAAAMNAACSGRDRKATMIGLEREIGGKLAGICGFGGTWREMHGRVRIAAILADPARAPETGERLSHQRMLRHPRHE